MSTNRKLLLTYRSYNYFVLRIANFGKTAYTGYDLMYSKMMQSPQLLPILYCMTFEALSPSLDESFFSTLGCYNRKMLFFTLDGYNFEKFCKNDILRWCHKYIPCGCTRGGRRSYSKTWVSSEISSPTATSIVHSPNERLLVSSEDWKTTILETTRKSVPTKRSLNGNNINYNFFTSWKNVKIWIWIV